MPLNLPGNTNQETAGAYTARMFNALRDESLKQRKAQLENQFKPLDVAIKAQNALSYNNRMGNVGLFLRGIAQMPADERQAYLAQPENRANYMSMLEEFRQGIKNPQMGAGGNILTPQFVQSILQPPSNPFAMLMGKLFGGGQQQPQNAFAEAQQAMPQAQPQTNQLSAPQQPLGQGSAPPIPTSIGGVPGEIIPDVGTGYDPTQQVAQQPAPETQPKAEAPIKELTDKERSDLAAKMRVNNKAVGPDIKNRADAAIAFEQFLKYQRKQIGKVFDDAFKYSQIYGRGKDWLDKFKKKQPKEYANYIKAKNSLIPLMANGIRFLEKMGVSHEAQEDAKNQIAAAINSIDISPDVGREVFNDHMRALADVTRGVIDASEPIYKGVRMRLQGLEHFKGNYIPMRIEVVNSKGQKGTIPEDQLDDAMKAGYQRIGTNG